MSDLPGQSAAGPTAPAAGGRARVAAFSYFFPAHDEAANLEPLVREALGALPLLAERFEIICVDDGSTDGTAAIADRLAQEHPDIVRVVHHPTNLGYGQALRSGLRAARFELVGFTDGDRQFRVADLGRLLDHLHRASGLAAEPASGLAAEPTARPPDVVAGFRIRRADPALRLAYARVYRGCLRALFGLRVRDPDCACKVIRRDALRGIRVASSGAFLSAELLIKIEAGGARLVEQGVPHYPRTAGRASGADPRVVLRAVRDFWCLRLGLWFDRAAALSSGDPILPED